MELFAPDKEGSQGDFESPVVPAAWLLPGAPALEIDVGCHKGLFLMAMAQRHPERNFLGLERQSSRVEKCRKKISRLGIPNARVTRAEALPAFREGLPAACADVIHVLFPDPWPKRRHHIRRLLQEEFLASCARVLKPGGLLRIMTDDADYAVAIKNSVVQSAKFVTIPWKADYPETEFQKKFAASKRFHGLALVVLAP